MLPRVKSQDIWSVECVSKFSLLFSWDQRLTKPTDFQRVFRQGKRLKIHGFVIHYRVNNLAHPRLGLAIAKKVVKTAVQRNNIKRAIRESFRQNQKSLSSLDIVFVARHGLPTIPLHERRAILFKVWQRLNSA